MDAKSAILPTKGSHQTFFVRPPRKENDPNGLWKLLIPVYGLSGGTDSISSAAGRQPLRTVSEILPVWPVPESRVK